MYDYTTRKKPAPFQICNYGVELESIKYAVLTKNGLEDSKVPPLTILSDDSESYLAITEAIKHDELKEYYLAIQITDMVSAGCVESDKDSLYVVEILGVSPLSRTKADLDRALVFAGPGRDAPESTNVLMQCECLIQYGSAAHLWQATGDDRAQLINEASKRLDKIKGLCGFYFDQTQNKMGESGWDWIRSRELADQE